MASRILGMGDVMSFIEKAEKTVDADRAEELERKIRKQQFGLDDFLEQMKQVRRMGPIGNLIGMLPGFGQLKTAQRSEGRRARARPHRGDRHLDDASRSGVTPKIIDGSRRKRIAHGSGTTVQAVNQLIKQFGQMQKIMRQVQQGKIPSLQQLGRGLRASGRGPPRQRSRMLCRRSQPSGIQELPERQQLSVRIRLTRVGARNNPVWRVVAADQRSPRDGRFIEVLGHYNPQTDPSTIELDEERVLSWLRNGAQPCGTVKKLLKAKGISA